MDFIMTGLLKDPVIKLHCCSSCSAVVFEMASVARVPDTAEAPVFDVGRLGDFPGVHSMISTDSVSSQLFRLVLPVPTPSGWNFRSRMLMISRDNEKQILLL